MLDLIRLGLDGFGSYDKLDLPLKEPGTFFITGPTGSGKSTIPWAVYYLLSGKPLRKKSEFTSVKDYSNKVLGRGHDIQLDYINNGKMCKIREIRGRKSKIEGEQDGLYYYVDGEDCRGARDQETRINILKDLCVSPEDIKNISMLGRRQSQAMIQGTSAERGAVLVEVYKLDKYDEAIKSCTQESKDLSSGIKSLEGKIKDYEESTNSLRDSLQSDEVEEISEDEIDSAKQKIISTKEKLKKIREKDREVRDILSKIGTLRKQQNNLRDLNTEIDALEKELDTLSRPSRTFQVLEKVLGEVQEKKAVAKSEIEKLREDLTRIKKLKNKCPINEKDCPANVPRDYKEQMVHDCTESIEVNEEVGRDLEEEAKSLREEKESIEKYEELIRQLKNKNSAKEMITVSEVPDDKEATKNLKKCDDGLKRGNQRLEELQDEHEALLLKRQAYLDREKFQQKIADTIEEKESNLREFRQELDSLNIDLQYAATAASLFHKAKLYKIDLILELLNENANHILNRISDGERQLTIVSQKKDAQGKKTLDKLGILVSDSYKTLPVELVSDGQEMQVGLAVLLGMWKTSGDLTDKSVSFLWLDEVFGPLDSDTIDRVFETVVELSKEFGARSIYIISHRNLDIRLFDWKWKTEIEDGVSELITESLN
jgi:exonuclease SbcC